MTTERADGGDQSRPARSPATGILITIVGLLVAAWVGFGRVPFGVAGELTPVFALVALLIGTLQAFAGRAAFVAARRGHRLGVWTVIVVAFSWAWGIVCGFTLPDLTAIGLQTIATGPHQPALGFAIGVTNPAGILTIALSIAAVVLAYRDARGGRPKYDEDAILDAYEDGQSR